MTILLWIALIVCVYVIVGRSMCRDSKTPHYTRLIERGYAQEWNDRHIPQANITAATRAHNFMDLLDECGLKPDGLKLLVDGGIGVSFRGFDRICYVDFYNDGAIFGICSDGTILDCRNIIRDIHERLRVSAVFEKTRKI